MEAIREVFQFITELDKLKAVTRQNNPVGLNRRENSAEHSWQAAVLAMSMEQFSPQKVDIFRVVQMLLLHDVVEIDAGDTILYDEKGREEKEKEERASAERIFALLPDSIGEKYLSIWNEFEDRKTPEAIYAYAMDRLIPVVQNFVNRPTTWEEHGATLEQVIRLNTPIGDGVPDAWKIAEKEIRSAFDEFQSK